MDPRDALMKKLNQKFGDYSVFKMDSREELVRTKVLPTGSLSLDLAIGVGGFPRGRITEIYGPEAAGKSLLLLSTIAQTQANGGYCAFIDVEHALSPDFARLLGVNTEQLYYAQPDDGEQALKLMEELIQSGLFDIVGLDSVAALVTKKELEIGYGDYKIADTAIMMAKALKRMTHEISKTQTVAVFINQLREKPMVMFGSPEYTPGGKSMKFYASLRIHVKKTKV
jgi:recombination protein RecA